MTSVSHFQKMNGTPNGEINKGTEDLDNTINQLN